MKPESSRLGFGLSGIAGSGNFAHQERLVKTAIDSGITHFDVAPSYGSGDAEKILGKILASCPEEVTVTTKFGLAPFSAGKIGTILRSVLRPLFRQAKSLKTLASAVMNRTTSHTNEHIKTEYVEGSLLASVQQSTTNLRRPIDILLLHDADDEFAQNAALLKELDEVRGTGLARFTGISGDAPILTEMCYKYPKTYTVVQLENSLTNEAPMEVLTNSGAYIITHRAIQGGIKKIQFLIENRPGFRNVWLKEIGIDPDVPENLAQALIALALAENPTGTILFSTTNPGRVKKTAETITSPILKNDNIRKIRMLLNEVV